MKLLLILIYALVAMSIFNGLYAQVLPTMAASTTPAAGSTTTVTSEVEIIPTTNDLGQSITLTETTRLGGPPQTTSSSVPRSTAASTSSSGGTTSDLATSSTTASRSATSTTTSPTTSCSLNASSPTTSGSIDSCVTVHTIPPRWPAWIIAVVILIFIGVSIMLYVFWRFQRRKYRDEPEENAPWWVHPANTFRQLLPGADSHARRPTEKFPVERVRPTISHPIPIYQPSQTPPPRPQYRPSSLSHSLIREMNTSPMLSRSPQELAAAGTGHPTHTGGSITTDDEKNRSLNPRPLQIVRPKNISGPNERDLEANRPFPASARSSTSNYSTLIAGPSQPKPAYLPYRQPDSPPASKLGQRGFMENPSHGQHRIAHDKLYQPPPFADEDEDNLQVKQLRREEALRMLEENTGQNEIQTAFDGNVEETRSLQSQKSFDFVGHRARKVLDEKKQREEFEKNRLAQQNDAPPVPKLPASYRKR